jgi:thioesterase domain-containing protein
VLSQHPSVAHAVAMVREDRPGDRRLVVYAVVLDAAESAVPVARDPMELRRFLSGRLPDYMVPSAVVVLDALPLNPNGKVDRKALPAPTADRAASSADYVAPRTPLEETLAGAWAEILGLERIGIHDNFFELGGHSLLAVRLFSRLAEVLGHSPRMSVLFQAPTVAAFAEMLQRGGGSPATPEIIPLRTTGARQPLFCVPGVLGMGFIFVDLARYTGADQPLYALQARGFSGETPHTRIEAIAAYYIESMRTVQPTGPYRILGYSMGGTISYEMARQLRQAGQEVAFVGMIDAACRATAPADQVVGPADWDGAAAGMGLRLDGRTLERLVRLGPEQLSAAEREQVLASGLGPPGMTLGELRPMVPVLGGNFQAFWQFRAPAQSFRVTFFRACEPYPAPGAVPDADGGWGKLAPVDVRYVSGLHHTVVREPHVRILAERLRECIDELEARTR